LVKRAKEVGTRKTVRALRAWLAMQFMGEAFFLAIFALLFTLALIITTLPFFKTLTGKQLRLPFSSISLVSGEVLLRSWAARVLLQAFTLLYTLRR
jgi:hypothetical protein